MSLEKPWSKPFDKLLNEMVDWWRGEISEVSVYDGPGAFRVISSSIYEYPKFRAEIKGRRLVIEMAESPAGDVLFFDGNDNVEFLRIYVLVPTAYKMLIRQERFMDKVMKAVRLEIEFQTGSEDFDKRYFLEVKTEADRNLLRSSSFQRLVSGLEPFATLRIYPNNICWSHEIERKSQLEFANVRDYVQRLMDFADKISQPEPFDRWRGWTQ